MLAGVALVVASVGWLSGAHGAIWYAAGFLLLQAGSNAVTAAYQALLPDVVPASQRGLASGLLGVMQILGNAASLGLALALLSQVTATHQTAAGSGTVRFLVVTTAGLLACCLVTALGVREADGAQTVPAGIKSWFEPWRHAGYRRVFGARGLVMMGLTLFMTFIEFYFVRVVHISDFVTATAIVALVALGVAVVGAAALGAISDRTPRVPLACAATVLMGLAAALFLVPGAVSLLWPLGAVFGLGYGAYMSVDWALAIDSLPSAGAAGRDLGVFSLAGTLPALMGPAVGGALVSVFGAVGRTDQGYQAIFVVAVLCFLGGAAGVLRVREPPHALRM
jgi:MFS family permease